MFEILPLFYIDQIIRGNLMKKFKKIFEQENLSEAIDYINHLKSNLNDFPKFLVEYLIITYYNIIVDNIYSKERGVPNDRNENWRLD